MPPLVMITAARAKPYTRPSEEGTKANTPLQLLYLPPWGRLYSGRPGAQSRPVPPAQALSIRPGHRLPVVAAAQQRDDGRVHVVADEVNAAVPGDEVRP